MRSAIAFAVSHYGQCIKRSVWRMITPLMRMILLLSYSAKTIVLIIYEVILLGRDIRVTFEDRPPPKKRFKTKIF